MFGKIINKSFYFNFVKHFARKEKKFIKDVMHEQVSKKFDTISDEAKIIDLNKLHRETDEQQLRRTSMIQEDENENFEVENNLNVFVLHEHVQKSNLDTLERINSKFDLQFTFEGPKLKQDYQKLNFEDDIMPMVQNLYKLGLTDFQIKVMLKKNFRIFLEEDLIKKVNHFYHFLNSKLNITNSEELISCNPKILNQTDQLITKNIEGIKTYLNFTNEQLLPMLTEYPILLTDFSSEITKIEFYFNLYLEMPKEEFIKYTLSFPLMLTASVDNVLNIFRVVDNYNFDRKEWYGVIKKNPKVFIFRFSQVKNIIALLAEYKIKPKETFEFIKKYPEMLLINRHNLLKRKLELFDNLGMNKATVRNLIRSYPFILMKSYNSFINKVYYFNDILGMKIQDIDIYPLIFCFNLNRDIKPRCYLMRKYNNWIPFQEAFALTPEEFTKRLGVPMEEYQHEEEGPLYERDLMFRYSKYYSI